MYTASHRVASATGAQEHTNHATTPHGHPPPHPTAALSPVVNQLRLLADYGLQSIHRLAHC